MRQFLLICLWCIPWVVYSQNDCNIATENPGFELPVIPQNGSPSFRDASLVPGWETTASDNVFEIWPSTTNYGGQIAYEGNQYIELNAEEASGVYQDFDTPLAGIVFEYSFAHSARNSSSWGSDVVGVYAGAPGEELVQIGEFSSAVYTGWSLKTGTYTVPEGQTVTRFLFEAVSTATGDPTIGNFLDAINFTSNFGLASSDDITISCEENIATGIQTVGSGFWTTSPLNPSPTTIIDLGDNNYSIEGFSISGDYIFTWSNSFCDAELIVHYSNESFELSDDSIEHSQCSDVTTIDLTQFEPQITNELVQFSYYLDMDDAQAGNTNTISDPSNFPLTGDVTIYVRVERIGFCASFAEIGITLTDQPDAEPEISPLPLCDTDLDGFIEFNLDDYQIDLIDDPSSFDFDYYLSEEDAQTETNPQSAIVLLQPGESVTYWVVISLGNCKTLSQIHLTANQGLQGVLNQTEIQPAFFCDETFSGTVSVNLTNWEEVLISDSNEIDFTYFSSESDAENNTDPIVTDLENYSITGDTTIWIVLTNQDGCKEIRYVEYDLGEQIQINSNTFELGIICLDANSTIDLTQMEGQISNEVIDDYFYYETLSQAELGNSDFISTPENYAISGSGSVFIRIESNGRCPNIVELNWEEGENIAHNSPPFELEEACEGESLDLTEIMIQINPDTAIGYTFYASEDDAWGGLNPISSPDSFIPENNSGTLYVKLELDGFCPAVLPFDYVLNPFPMDPFSSLPTICPGEEITLDAGDEFPEENYVWEWDGQEFTGPVIIISEPNNYTLTITSDQGCERIIPVEIELSAPPVISNVQVGSDYFIVELTGNYENLEYSLDGVFWQTSPRFDNLIPGKEYTFYVRENGCTPVSKTISIMYSPNFISPNGDGYNDTWSVRGINDLSNIHIKIFDRYGKIFVDSKPQNNNNISWNGRYNGSTVPSGDYWYIITAKDENLTDIKYVGQISVRNRD